MNGLLPAAEGIEGVLGMDDEAGMDGADGVVRADGPAMLDGIAMEGAAGLAALTAELELDAAGLLGMEGCPLTMGAAS